MDISALTASGLQPNTAAPAMPAGADSFADFMSGELARQKAAGAIANGRIPSAREAQLTAAQIAAQANVLGPLKRDPIVPGAGMNTQAAAPVPSAVPGKFFPLHRAPVVAQGQTSPSRVIAPTTVESLRATQKYATGPVATTNSVAQRYAIPQTTGPQVAVPKTAPSTPAQDLPPWFTQAMQNLDKYDAMKANR